VELKILLLTIGIMTLVVLGLGIGIFFSKKKSFPETSISKNPEMQKRNITCAKHDEYKACGLNGGCHGDKNHENNEE
jgi:uncharacterized protein YneF (UPF0154 family)